MVLCHPPRKSGYVALLKSRFGMAKMQPHQTSLYSMLAPRAAVGEEIIPRNVGPSGARQGRYLSSLVLTLG